ncbi:hypothetical protein HY385_01405 [Candidatus Daviesbacteria bacterium]|nr:hypothetical protein [Candidatus Daviesbacteria bacterium]
MNLFPAFFDRPTAIKFSDQEEGEWIELFLRQHWITNLPWLIMTFLGILLPLAVIRFSSLLEFLNVLQPPQEILIALVILWYLFILAFVLSKWLHWYFNIYIVTNTHLVDINFHNLLNRDFTEVRLDDIQSAKSEIKGIVGSLFNFGNLAIETAAEKQRINFMLVPKPDFVKERIQDLQELEEGKDVT